MIKISKLADYAVVILAAMSKQPEELLTAAGVSNKTGLPEPTAAKVLKLLCKAELLRSVRGASGGYKLAHGAAQINIAQIIEAVDGPVSLTACVEGTGDECSYQMMCPVKGRWDPVNEAVNKALTNVILTEMVREEPSMQEAKSA